MSYDVLLNRSMAARLNAFEPTNTAHQDHNQILRSNSQMNNDSGGGGGGGSGGGLGTSGSSSSGTPSRKISAFLNSLTLSSSSNNDDSNNHHHHHHQQQPQHHNHNQQNSDDADGAAAFPEIKGRVESKLISMWHNVKYGWSGKIKSNFSKEQPVWLLGRCYHRKFSPLSSMETSAEMTSSLENKLYLNEPTQQHHQYTTFEQVQQQLDELCDPTVQEYGTDAIEGEHGEYQWEEGIEGFKRDFYSRLWLTYRREFPLLNNSTYTSDCGWGCMLRSGQMLLAQALLCHFLSRSWRWDPESQLHTTYEDNMHRKIIRWFGDSSSKNSPFSIHTLVSLGTATGKKPGDWYGPSSVSHLLKQAVKLASQENADFDNIHVYVAQDCTVYIQDILDECLVPDPSAGPVAPWQQKNEHSSSSRKNSKNMHWKALILLVPLRLGTEKLNPIYGNSLKSMLSTEYCIGIIGGRPKHSLYFVGFQEDKLIHLDPHYCQEMVDVNQENFSSLSFHCKSPRKLKLSKLDPSCCIGFYCQTRTDFDNFVESVQPFLLPVRSQTPAPNGGSPNNSQMEANYPMFVFSKLRSSDEETKENEEVASAYKLMHQQLRSMKDEQNDALMQSQSQTDSDDNDETEEFVIL